MTDFHYQLNPVPQSCTLCKL